MTRFTSADVGFLFVGGYNLNNISETLEVTTSMPVIDTTPLGASTQQYENPGMKKYEVSGHDGWYDTSTTSINAAMVGMAAGSNVFMFGLEGNVNARRAICAGGALKTEYKRKATVGEFTKASLGVAITGAIDDAFIVHALALETGTGHNEALDVDMVSSGAAGCNVYVACSGVVWNGATALDIVFEDSSDGITYSPQTAMTQVTAAGSPAGIFAEKKASSDMTVNHYVAAKWTFTGGASPTATFVLSVKVN